MWMQKTLLDFFDLEKNKKKRNTVAAK